MWQFPVDGSEPYALGELNVMRATEPKLAPGATTSIVLRVDTPKTVKRIALTENGSIVTEGTLPHRFSFGQALFLNSNKE